MINWDVSNVRNMNGMFADAKSFNQPLNSWNVNEVRTMNGVFIDSALSNAHYDRILTSWGNQNLQTNVRFGASAQYCTGESGRNERLKEQSQ